MPPLKIFTLLALQLFFSATLLAQKPWPKSMPVVKIGGKSYDCILYPFHDVDADAHTSEVCSRDLAKTFHPYLDRKHEYRLCSDSTLLLTKMRRADFEGKFVDVTSCFLGTTKELPTHYTGVIIIPQERHYKCEHRIIWLEEGKVKYDITYDYPSFEEKLKENEKNLSAEETSVRMMLNEYFYGDWASANYWPK